MSMVFKHIGIGTDGIDLVAEVAHGFLLRASLGEDRALGVADAGLAIDQDRGLDVVRAGLDALGIIRVVFIVVDAGAVAFDLLGFLHDAGTVVVQGVATAR